MYFSTKSLFFVALLLVLRPVDSSGLSDDSSLTVVKGGVATFKCSLDNIPWQWCRWKNRRSQAQFSFTADSVSEAINDRFHVQLEDHFCNLIIYEVTLEDAGEWNCHLAVTSDVPSVMRTEKSMHLTVAVMEESDLIFKVSKALDKVQIGEEVEIFCGAQHPNAFPKPQMELIVVNKDEETLMSERGSNITKVFEITDQYHEAKFECQLSQEHEDFSHVISQRSDAIFAQIPIELLCAPQEEYVFRDQPFNITLSFRARPQPSWDQIMVTTFSDESQVITNELNLNESSLDLAISPLIEVNNQTDEYAVLITILQLKESVILNANISDFESVEMLVKYEPPPSYFVTMTPKLVQEAGFTWMSWIFILFAVLILIIVLVCCLMIVQALISICRGKSDPSKRVSPDYSSDEVFITSESSFFPTKGTKHLLTFSPPKRNQLSSDDMSTYSIGFSDSTATPPETSSSDSILRNQVHPAKKDMVDYPSDDHVTSAKSLLLPNIGVERIQTCSPSNPNQVSSEGIYTSSTVITDSTATSQKGSLNDRVPRMGTQRPKSQTLPIRPRTDIENRQNTLRRSFSPSEAERADWRLKYSGPTHTPVWTQKNTFQTFKPSPKLPGRRIQQFHYLPK